MSHPVIPAVETGTRQVIGLVESTVNEKIARHRGEELIAFNDTLFPLPIAYALLGVESPTYGNLPALVERIKGVAEGRDSALNLAGLDGTVNRGLATALGVELLKALQKGKEPSGIGFIADNVLRSLGLLLVDGRMPGVAVIVGKAPNSAIAEQIIRDFQRRNILSLIVGNQANESILQQLQENHVEIGLETYVVPLGGDIGSAVYALNFAMRAALTFGGVRLGEAQKALTYCRERVPAFCLVLGEIGAITAAAGAAAIAMGFPIITDQPLEPIGQTGTTRFETLVVEKDYQKIAGRCLESRGIKVKIAEIDIPVHFGSAFEGERIRKEDMQVQFGGKYSKAFEWATSAGMDQIEDNTITLHGPDIDQVEIGSAMPLAVVVKTAGRSMQPMFEPVIERHIHSFLNQAMGVFHMGQRELIWMRIGKEAFAKGFRLKHLGVILHAKIHGNFSKIVDKVAVEIYTDAEQVRALLPDAMAAFEQRDRRSANMTDESVDEFYSCALCQSFAPNHICIIKPERPGLCGAYTWLDGKSSYEIDPTGPNQPVKKGQVLNPAKGEWQGVNDFVVSASNQTIDKFNAYTIMEHPETSCGCFECIVAILPEANGFILVNREYNGMTPTGMSFSTLAGSVGGGVQSPGFMGIGKKYIVSKKFISADGGLKRIVWMPSELKEALREALQARAEEVGEPDLLEKIADETRAVESDQVLEYLSQVGHPALAMDPLF
jgi:acetyl-CoA synthase